MTNDIEPAEPERSLQPFEDLEAPEPIDAAPPASARWLAFTSIVVGGVLGALVGFGVGDVMGGNSTWASVGALLGAITGAVGVGVLANLTLRAMNEWRAVDHPEQQISDRRRDRRWTRRTS